MERKQLNIYYLDFEAEDRAGQQPASAHELQVRLVERDDLAARDADDTNAMFIEWREKGKIFLQEEMLELDLMMQLKLVRGSTYVGSISFPFREVLELRRDFQQWLTVFDTLEDDVFDGTIGLSDEETPRIFVGFEIKDQSFDEDDDEMQEVRLPHQAAHPQDLQASKDSFVVEAKKAVESNHAALSSLKQPQKSDSPDKPKPPAPPASKKEEPSPKPSKVEGKRDSDKKTEALRNSTDAKKVASKPSTAAHTSSTSASKTPSKPLVLGSPQTTHPQEPSAGKKAPPSRVHDHQVHQPPTHSLAESMQSARSSKNRGEPAKKPSHSEELELKASELQIEAEKYARMTRLRLSLDNCHLVIQDLNRQLSSSKAENDSLSTTLATLRANHKKALKEVTEAHQRELQQALKQSRHRSDSEDRDLELA